MTGEAELPKRHSQAEPGNEGEAFSFQGINAVVFVGQFFLPAISQVEKLAGWKAHPT